MPADLVSPAITPTNGGVSVSWPTNVGTHVVLTASSKVAQLRTLRAMSAPRKESLRDRLAIHIVQGSDGKYRALVPILLEPRLFRLEGE